jgi:hypothetical protein
MHVFRRNKDRIQKPGWNRKVTGKHRGRGWGRGKSYGMTETEACLLDDPHKWKHLKKRKRKLGRRGGREIIFPSISLNTTLKDVSNTCTFSG